MDQCPTQVTERLKTPKRFFFAFCFFKGISTPIDSLNVEK